jgi:xylan 1,4-beta-xylosidase
MFCLLWISSALATSFADTYSISVDAGTTWGGLPHFWSRCFGIGRAGLVLDTTCQAHIRDGVHNLGLQGVRFHAIFADDIGIYKESNGNPVYTWTKVDSVFDFLVGLDTKPIVELGFMPHDLALYPDHTIMQYKAIASMPKDWNRWRDLIYETVSHFKQRYGETALSQWRFEVWNEPDLNCDGCFWWGGSQEDYFRLYDYAVAGATAAYADVKIGGPVPSGYYKFAYITDFLNHVSSQNSATGASSTKVDFISYHTWHEYWKTVDAHFWVMRELNKYPALQNVESVNTEFGPTWQFGLVPQPQESENGAAFLARVISEISRRCHAENVRFPFAYSWWVLSDIFDEGAYHDDKPFPSCMGLISRQSITKPAYNVYKMLNMLGTRQVSITSSSGNGNVHGLAAADSTGAVQVLLYNQITDYPDCTAPVSGTDRIELAVGGLTNTKYSYRCYLVDQNHANAQQAWEDMGSPAMNAMSVGDWSTLRTSMVLQPVESDSAMELSGGAFSKTYDLAREGVMLVTLTPAATGIISRTPTASVQTKPYRLDNCAASLRIVPVTGRSCAVRLSALNGRKVFSDGPSEGARIIDKRRMTPGVYVLGIENAGKIWREHIVVTP